MSDAAWLGALVEGLIALAAAAALFLGARVRFHGRRGPGAGADVGLD